MHEPLPGLLYLVAGGYHRRADLDPVPLLADILAQVGAASPRVACLGSANGDDPRFHRWAGGLFAAAGAGRVELAPSAPSRARRADPRPVLEAADVVFVSGGDVETGMANLAASGLAPLLRRLHRGGRPFIGLSAGTILLGRSWVRWRDPADDATAEPFDCLGLAPLVCDTHEEDDDWPELRTLLSVAPGCAEGYGIPSGAALRVAPDGGLDAMAGPVHRLARRDGRIVRLADLLPGKPG